MRRSGLLVLMVVVLSAALLEAQRAAGGSSAGARGGAFHAGGSPARMPGGNGMRPSHGRFPGNSGFHHHPGFGITGPGRFGAGAFWPGYSPYRDYWSIPLNWDLPFWNYQLDPDDYQQPVYAASPQVIVVQNKEPRQPAPPPEPPKLIEAPQWKGAPVAKQHPPTVFVLSTGERLESRRYLLTASSLQIQVGRQQRTIPLMAVDVDATVSANHERGTELTIPQDRSSMFLSF